MASVETTAGGLFIDTACPQDEFEEAQCIIYGDDDYDDDRDWDDYDDEFDWGFLGIDWGTDPDDYYDYDDGS